MENFLTKLSLVVVILGYSQGTSLMTLKEPSRCGNWIPYNGEKCLNIMDKTSHQTQEDAEIICGSFTEEQKQGNIPKLIAIKTQEEQDFLTELLFNQNEILDNVWIGLKAENNSSSFRWNDGSEVFFSNWANQTISDSYHRCVQMESGKGVYPAGRWVKVHCQKRTTVVCERLQAISVAELQTMFLNYKFEQERKEEEWTQKINTLEKRNLASEQEINTLKKFSGVPVGFTYVQLPGQADPSTIWPKATWSEISATYSGLFFRVVGNEAKPFGEVQESNSSHLVQVSWTRDGPENHPLTVPSDGSWSNTVYSGAGAGDRDYLKFRMSGAEVRPRNQAVKIWKSIA